MKKQIGLMTLSLLLATPALAGGAGAPVAKPAAACKSIAQIVSADANFSTLATAIDAAGAKATLSGQGSFTVFAPTNAAFAKVPSDQLAALLNDPEALKALVLYHVVAEKATAAQIRQVSGGTTVQGDEISVSVSGNKVMINNATVTKADVNACNGIIHVIDTVLVPPNAPEAQAPAPAPEPVAEAPAEPAPAEPAPAEPATEAEAPAEPATEAAAPAPVQASAAFDISSIPALPLSGATATTTATTETATTETTTEATTETTEATTETTEATGEASTTETTEAPAAESTEVVVTNTVYDALAAADQYSTFVGLLSDADLTEVLTSGEYTVFAPTDTAFAAFPEETLTAISSDQDALKKFLQYYIVNKKVTADQVAAGEEIQTLAGSPLKLGTATLQTAVTADNGVIFPVDAVVLPEGFVVPTLTAIPEDTTPTPAAAPATTTATTTTTTTTTVVAPANVVALVTTDTRFSTLAALLTKAGLVDALTTGEYTIFAPTNDAFAKVDKAKLDAIAADPDKLKAVLLYHVVTGRPAADALLTAPLTTMEGTPLTVAKADGGLTIGDGAKSDGVVVNGGNANVYILDSVLLPPSVR